MRLKMKIKRRDTEGTERDFPLSGRFVTGVRPSGRFGEIDTIVQNPAVIQGKHAVLFQTGYSGAFNKRLSQALGKRIAASVPTY